VVKKKYMRLRRNYSEEHAAVPFYRTSIELKLDKEEADCWHFAIGILLFTGSDRKWSKSVRSLYKVKSSDVAMSFCFVQVVRGEEEEEESASVVNVCTTMQS